MASLCHLWFTTTNLSYRFPIRRRLVRYYWYSWMICLISNLGWCKYLRQSQKLEEGERERESEGERERERETERDRERQRERERHTFLWITSHGSVLITRVFCLRHKFLHVLVNSPRSPVSFAFLLLFKSQFAGQIHCWRVLNSWWTPRSVVYLKHGVRDNSQFCWMFFSGYKPPFTVSDNLFQGFQP